MNHTFHDAIVTDVHVAADELTLDVAFVSVYVGDELVRQEAGQLRLVSVSSNSSTVSDLGAAMQQFDDAQILRLTIEAEGCRLLLEWEHYSLERTQTRDYWLPAARVVWQPHGGQEFALSPLSTNAKL